MEKFMNKLTLFLLILGGFNLGTVALFGINVIAIPFDNNESAMGVRVIYAVIAACSIWCISLLFKDEAANRIKRRRY